jgi:hypothetical protein
VFSAFSSSITFPNLLTWYISCYHAHQRVDSFFTLTMARTEMIQASTSVAQAQPRTPPSSPSLPPSEHVVTLSNAQEFIDLVKAVVAMQTSPTNQPSTQIVTTEHVQQFLDILKSLSAKPGPPPPPGKPSKATGNVLSARASRLEFKTVHEVCVFCEFQVQMCCS